MRRYTYDKVRHHLTATDRRAMAAMLAAIGDLKTVGCNTPRNRYTLTVEGKSGAVTIQNGEGEWRVPLAFDGDRP